MYKRQGKGSIELRDKICEYLKDRKINTNIENIQIISGAQQGIDIVCKGLINYSDVVFVEEPTYNLSLIHIYHDAGALAKVDQQVIQLVIEDSQDKAINYLIF